jgi:hypothetical protein
MKIIISERQENMISENMSKDNIRKFCYQIWDKQKKMGEEPYIDDVIFDFTGIKKYSLKDNTIIRPIWYEYNGGLNNLYKKLEEEVLDNTFRIVAPEIDLDARVKVVDVTMYSAYGYQYDVASLKVNMDGQGTIGYESYDDETEEQIILSGNLWDALFEAQEAYETGDFYGGLRYHVHEYFYKLLDKYGIPIDVDDVEIEDFN